jgi:hypothetical protein
VPVRVDLEDVNSVLDGSRDLYMQV